MAIEMICLDTSVLIDFYRKKNKSKSFFYELTNRYQLFAVSAITAYEVYAGSSTVQDEFWDKFFQTISVLPFDNDINKTAIDIQRELKRDRKQIEIPDLFIGATAIQHGLKLATLNTRHFERIVGLQIIKK